MPEYEREEDQRTAGDEKRKTKDHAHDRNDHGDGGEKRYYGSPW